MLLELYRRLRGYLLVEVIGSEPERLLNLAAMEHLPCWKPVPIAGGFLFYTNIRSYRRIARAARGLSLRTRIREKHGLPFVAARQKKRVGILVGFLIGFSCILALQSFAWRIEVVGNNRLSEAEILSAASDCGVGVGAFLPTLDLDEISLSMQQLLPEVGWLSVNRFGSLVTVELHESVVVIPRENTAIRNVVAAKDGQIVELEVYRGGSEVKMGDVVTKGQLLVSGIITGTMEKESLHAASAKVIAETVELQTFTTPLTVEKTVYQKDKTFHYLSVGGNQIPLFFSFLLPKQALTTVSERPLVLFGCKLPISMITANLQPYTVEQVTLSEKEAERLLTQQQREYEAALPTGMEIVSSDGEFFVENEQISLKVTYVFREDIAQYEEITIK